MKKKRVEAKKAVSEAAKNEKNAIKRKNRLLKARTVSRRIQVQLAAPAACVCFRWIVCQAAKNLSAGDLQLLLNAKDSCKHVM